MLFFPYKKLIVKTQMNAEEIFSALANITFEQIWLHKNHKAYFWGSLDSSTKKFKLKLNDNSTILSYITKGKIEEKEKSTNIIISIRWSMIPMIVYSYFFIIKTIVVFALIGMVLFSFDIKGICMGIFSLSLFYLIDKLQLKRIGLKEKHNSIIRKILMVTNGEIVFTNKY